MQECPTDEQIVELAAGHLPEEGRARIEAHLDSCDDCRAVLAAAAAEPVVPSAASTPAANPGPFPRDPDEPLEAGAQIGRYVVVGTLGAGGMGIVHAAYDPQLDRKVAIKLLRTRAFDATALQALRIRLLREAQAMARFSHPNVVPVHDIGEHEGHLFVAMELVAGTSLRAWARGKPWQKVLAAYRAAGEGLSAAHAAGLVHRDFKPDNVLVGGDGRPRVSDFGLARLVTEAEPSPSIGSGVERALVSPVTAAGTLLGTPAYMAPEQMRGEAGPAADQFSFCVALYEGLFGELPFDGRTVGELRSSIGQGAIREPRKSAVPRRIRRAIARGLSCDPAKRFASMRELVSALDLPARRLWAPVAAGVCAAAVGAAVAMQIWPSGLACRGATEQLSGIWDAARRAQIQSAFDGVKKPYAADAFATVSAAFDRYAHAWSEMRTEACRATHVRREQSAELLDLRMACLDQRREELRALTGLFAGADDEMVQRAPGAASRLSPLSGCADPVALLSRRRLPKGSGTVEQLAGLDTRSARAKALNLTGRFDEAVATAESALGEAHRLGSAVHEMQLSIVLGVLYANRGKAQESERTLQDALTLALRAGDEESTAASLTVLSWVVGVRGGRASEAEIWNRHAAAVISRLREPALWEQRRLKTLGRLRTMRGEYAAAVDSLSEAAKLGDGPGSQIPDADRAIVEEELGYALGFAGKSAEASAHVRRAIEIEERVSGPQSPHVATTRTTLASVLYREARYAEALEQLRLARTVLERTVGESRELGEVFDGLGANLLAMGDAAGALPEHRRASEVLLRSEGEKSAVAAHAVAGEGADLVALDRPREALPLLERALAVQEAAKADPIEVAETQATLAQALWKTDGDRVRARKLALGAQAAFAEAVAHYGGERERRRLADVSRWLEAHALPEPQRLGAR